MGKELGSAMVSLERNGKCINFEDRQTDRQIKRTFLLFRKVTKKSPTLSLGQKLQLSLKFLLQSRLLLSARLRGVDDILIVTAALGANPRGLFDAHVAQYVVGALDASLVATGALRRLLQRFVLAVPVRIMYE